MQSISELKEQAVTDTPVILFDCVLTDGREEHWSTHALTVGNTTYAARVLEHSAFDIQTASDQGVDGSPSISILLANADSHFSELERATGWKGARLTVSFLFYDLRNRTPLTDTAVVFQGICNPPVQIRESTFRLTATNRMNLQRLVMPEVRIQRRCPWTFPTITAQQQEATDGGVNGRYSTYYRCGYSAGQPGGKGNLNGSLPFIDCGHTRADCQARGMSNRFGGLEFVPPAIAVRSYGKAWSTSAVSVNQARYNDYVPIVYGTAWYEPLVTFARNDGNLTRMEVLLGLGPIEGVLMVLVNDVQIPMGVNGKNMTGTGWYNVVSLGTRDGAFDLNFVDSGGQPAGDPYGSMAYLSVVVPNQINDGNSLPTVKVLVQGLLLPVYDASGNYVGDQFSANPAWILLDVLRRGGWSLDEIDLKSFGAAAAYCDEQIATIDLNGNAVTVPRFACNLVLQKRRSAGDVVRGVRNCARLYLTYGSGGALQLAVENSLALQQPTQATCSNSTEELEGGWPTYEFGDGTADGTGILRKPNAEPSVVLSSRSIADTPNCLTVEFQDSFNGYQQDSYTVVDPDDVSRSGQQVTVTLAALGLPNYDQAARILKFNLDRTVHGNVYIEFATSVKAFGIRPGDLIAITYQKEGFNRQAFRVLRISPATNYRTATITAQIHDDAWYADANGQTTSAVGTRVQPNAGLGVPRPLIGDTLDEAGELIFGVTEDDSTASDGTVQTKVSVSFVPPSPQAPVAPGTPVVSLAAQLGSGGTFQAGEVLYYGVSAVNAAGGESDMSFLVSAAIQQDGSTVTLNGLSFTQDTSVFHVYRGTSPASLLRIASNLPVTSSFVDNGLQPQPIPPPDSNFDHANFYWRIENVPETAVTVHSPTTVGSSGLQMNADDYRGLTVRITRGKGAGQERTIASNTATVATTSAPWTIEPDSTSSFTITEAAWHFAALCKSSPVEFSIPNLGGETVEITGRAANVNDVECAPAISPVARWQIGGSGVNDAAVPPAPIFALSTGKAAGTLELSSISFSDLTNTRTISAATLALYYWDELLGIPPYKLGAPLGADDQGVVLSATRHAEIGSFIQIDAEVMAVTSVSDTGTQYVVQRGALETAAAAHSAGASIYHLAAKAVIAAFPREFFGTPYSGTWTYPISLPDVRLAGGTLFLTNNKGNGPTASISLTHSVNCGLRTLSGGQYTIQISGFLAIEQSAAPALVIEANHSVRDVYAILGTAADSPVQLQLNVDGAAYCQFAFGPSAIVSNSVDGSTLPPLAATSKLTLSIMAVGQTYPGADLTVIIRL
jgi:hypothetical protein